MPTRYLGREIWIEGHLSRPAGAEYPITSILASRWLRALYETPLLFSGILDGQGTVLEANEASIEGCGMVRAEIIGRPFWDGGWWSPDRSLAEQVERWCGQVVATGRSLRTTSRYFLGDGSTRMVDLSLYPVHDDDRPGQIETFVVATGLDITDALVARAEREEGLSLAAETLQRESEMRIHELAVVSDSERLVRDRLARLARAAVDMVGADSIGELTAIVFNAAFPILEAAGGALVIRDADELRVYLSDQMDDLTRLKYQEAPLDSPLPGRYVARTGQRLLFPNRAAGVAFLPEMEQVYQDTNRDAWAYFPLKRSGRLLGSLAISWQHEREFSDYEIALIESIAAQCSQSIERIQITQLNEEHTRRIAHMLESMQRSLLTSAPTGTDLDIASQYLPAAQAMHVGGDWYDAFTTKTDSTLLVVGDVAGHDGDSAARMAQLRNIFRGLAIDGTHGPAELLSLLDDAIEALDLDVLATVLVAQLEPDRSPRGHRRVTWATAGHPPPLIRLPDGSVEMATGRPDLLLGADPAASRHEQSLDLPVGSTMLLYTDGLIERRGETIDVGTRRLASALAGLPVHTSQDMCQTLLQIMVPGTPDDDVVVLAVRTVVADPSGQD